MDLHLSQTRRRKPVGAPSARLIALVGTVVVIATIFLFIYFVKPHIGLILALTVYACVRAPSSPGERSYAMRFDEIRDRRESLRFVQGFEDAAIGMAILTPELKLTRVNEALARMLGRPLEDVQDHCILEFTHPDDVLLTQGRRRHGRRRQTRRQALHPARPVDDGGDGADGPRAAGPRRALFSQLIDVTEQRRAELQKAAIAELGRQHVRWSDAVTTMNEALEIAQRILDADSCSVTRIGADGDFRVVAGTGEIPGPYDVLAGSASQSGYTLEEDAPVVCNDLLAEDRFLVPTFVLERKMRRSVSVPVPERGGPRHVMIAHAHEGPARVRRRGRALPGGAWRT